MENIHKFRLFTSKCLDNPKAVQEYYYIHEKAILDEIKVNKEAVIEAIEISVETPILLATFLTGYIIGCGN